MIIEFERAECNGRNEKAWKCVVREIVGSESAYPSENVVVLIVLTFNGAFFASWSGQPRSSGSQFWHVIR